MQGIRGMLKKGAGAGGAALAPARPWLAALALLLAMPSAHAARTVTLYFTDPQGTILMEKDAQGHILARHDYRPYGASQGAPAPAGPGYTGHVQDPDTGLVYMQQRYYDAEVGQFASVDPIGPTLGNIYNLNRYAYANNNPIVNIDPDGRQSAGQPDQERPPGCSTSAEGCPPPRPRRQRSLRPYND